MHSLKKSPIARVYAQCRKYAQQYSPKRLIKKLRYRWDKSLKPSHFRHYLSVVALVKNEADYIAEWLEYHLLQGVEKFYIYDNESTDKLQAVLKPYIEAGIVECIYYPGKEPPQVEAYNDAIQRFKYKSFWLAFIDIDEFIVPLSTGNIPDFLHPFERAAGIEINWVLYGNSGQEKKTEELVMERFTQHAEWDFIINHHVKSIVNPRMVACMYPHHADYLLNHLSVDSNGNKNTLQFIKRKPLHDRIRINHYFCKSSEEYLLKKEKSGWAIKYTMSLFNSHNRNEIVEDTLMKKYIPAVKERLQQRFAPGSIKQ